MYSTLPFDIFIKNNHHCMRPCLVYMFLVHCDPHHSLIDSFVCFLPHVSCFSITALWLCHSLSWACVHTYSCLFIFLFSCIVICYQCMVYIYLCTCFHILNCNIQYKLHLLWIIPILHYLHNCLCCLTSFLRQFTYYLHLLVCLEIIKFDEFISSPLLILIMTYSWIHIKQYSHFLSKFCAFNVI